MKTDRNRIEENFSRPNFYPGQRLDYKDFNRLSRQSDEVVALLCRHLFREGGILIDALDEFNVQPLEGLSVRIGSGVALLPSGQPIVLKHDSIFDLMPYRDHSESRTVVLGLVSDLKGTDRHSDPEEPSVTGFKTEIFEPKMVVGLDECPKGAVEIFRVRLNSKVQSLRMATNDEEWELEDKENKTDARIDLRFRKSVLSLNQEVLNPKDLIRMREALYSIESSHRLIQKTFLFDDRFGSSFYLNSLHLELLNRPFQPQRFGFLLSEFSEKFASFLESLSDFIGKSRTQLEREKVVEVIHFLSNFRKRSVRPRPIEIEKLFNLAQMMKAISDQTIQKFHFEQSVNEALLDLNDRFIQWDSSMSLAGRVFDRVDSVDSQNDKKVRAKGKDIHFRKVQSRFSDGKRVSLIGKHLKEGILSVQFSARYLDRPLVLISREFRRRGKEEIHFEINGKSFERKKKDESDVENQWRHSAWIVPPEVLVASDNQFLIRVENADLDFGFFDLVAYQPRRFGNEKEFES